MQKRCAIITLSGYIQKFILFVNKIKSGNFRAYTELTVYNDKVAGTIDLILVSPTGKILIYDYKSKLLGKLDKYDTDSFGNFTGIFEDLANNDQNRYSIQLSIYKQLLTYLFGDNDIQDDDIQLKGIIPFQYVVRHIVTGKQIGRAHV